jgi:hypothetical protein
MKNKLMIATAIAGLAFSANAGNAQTTVSGNLNLGYKAVGNKATKANSFDGFTKESQINISNKGSLNNGWTYAAGTSIEMDGTDTGATGMFSENTYIDLITGNTTITIGADHIQNSDFNMANIVGFADFTDLADGIGGQQSVALDTHNSPYGAYGVGIVQKTPVGSFSLLYTPSASSATAMNDIGNTSTKAQTGAANAAYEIGYRGDLSVKNLDVAAFYNATDSQTPGEPTASGKVKGKYYAAKYTFANNLSVAAEKGVNTATSGVDTTTKAYGVAYAISPNASIGYTYAKTNVDLTTGGDEVLHTVALGYSLGPVAANLQYLSAENVNNAAAADGEVVMFSLTTKF